MEIKHLAVSNFRQYYGTQEIDFSTDPENNVTVVNGANGAGKSTLLNAFLWLFYNEINLAQPDRLASERKLAEIEPTDTVRVSVTLKFDHEDRQYEARRWAEYRKQSQSDLDGKLVDNDVEVRFIDSTGASKTESNPNNALTHIMPERLRELFFFHGETIDELTANDGQEKIQEAIRNIMGLKILDRSIRHLNSVEKRFEKEMKKHVNEDLSDLLDRKQRVQDDIGDAKAELDEKKDNRLAVNRELKSVEDRLTELEESLDLQEERSDLKEERQELRDEIEDINAAIKAEISEKAYLVFGLPAIEETAKMLQEKRKKGEIPSEIKRTFVEDLLDLEECICGRPLEDGSEAREEVHSWKERAGSSDLEQVAMRLATRLSEHADHHDDLFEKIQSELEKRSERGDRIEEINGRLDDISTQLSDTDKEDISALEERRIELRTEASGLGEEIGGVKERISNLNDRLDTIKDEISEARKDNEKAELADRRRYVAGHVRDHIQGLFDDYQHEVREEVNERVNDIFRDIIAKDYYAQIDDDYSLRILKDVDEQEAVSVAKSTGERQVASLSFIATLVSLAKERYESDSDSIYFTGGIYPVIMDSPFGYLDPVYQQKVSKTMPQMAGQVVVLVTQAQYSDEVKREMDHIAGKKYELVYHDPAEDPDARYEYTEIREVEV